MDFLSGSPLMWALVSVLLVWGLGTTSFYCVAHMEWSEARDQMQKRIDGHQLALTAQKKRSATAWVKQRNEYEAALNRGAERQSAYLNDYMEADKARHLAESELHSACKALNATRALADRLSHELSDANHRFMAYRDWSGDPLTATVRDHVRRVVVAQLAKESGVALEVDDAGYVQLSDSCQCDENGHIVAIPHTGNVVVSADDSRPYASWFQPDGGEEDQE